MGREVVVEFVGVVLCVEQVLDVVTYDAFDFAAVGGFDFLSHNGVYEILLVIGLGCVRAAA